MKKNLMWNTFGSIFYSGCQWLITILVVHVADYEQAGYLSLAMSMSSSFSAISLFSMRNYQVSDVRGEFNTTRYVSSRIWTCLMAFITCAIFAGFSQSLYQALCIDAFMLIRVSEAFSDVMHGANQKHDRYDFIGISFIIRGIITVAGFTIVLMLTGNMVITLFLVAGLNLIVSLLYDSLMTHRVEKYSIRIIDKEIWTLLKKCLPLVVFSFLLSLETLIPRDILQVIYGTEVLGVYSSIASPAVIVQLFAAVVFNPFIPKLSNMYNDGEYLHFRESLHKIYLMLLLMMLVVVVGAMLLGRWGLKLLFGESILDSYYLFMPIIFVTLSTGIIWILSAVMILLRRIKQLLVYTVISFVICAALSYPIVLYFESNGVNIVQLISMPLLILLMIIDIEVYVAKRKDGVEG